MKVGIVGCGWVSGLHINAWRDAGMYVAAACDVNEKTAMQFAEKWKIPSFYIDLSEMLKGENLFAVSICAPPQFHADLATEALESGCHVVVEKPFTVTTKEADKVMNALQNASAKLTIIHSQLFEPSMLLAMKQIRAGSIGQIVGMEVVMLHSRDEQMAANRNHWCHKLPGGRFGENLPHAVYLLQAVLGNLEVRSVYADKLGNCPWMPFDELRVVLEADGKTGLIHINFNAPGSRKVNVYADIRGTGGSLQAGIYPISSLIATKPGRGIWGSENIIHQAKIGLSYLSTMLAKRKGPKRFSATHAIIIKSFVESIFDRGEPLVTPEMGYEEVRAVEKITRQMGKGSSLK